MLRKGSLNEPDWLSKSHLLSEEANSLSESGILENVKPESNAQSAHPVNLLSLLALSASKPAKRPITNSRSARHAR